jgi:transcriptional regulator with XRE-family HTH domain
VIRDDQPGRNVKRIRQEKGLTQEQLAELSGFSQQYISGLEQGRRNPTIVSIFELPSASATWISCALLPTNRVFGIAKPLGISAGALR